MNHVAGVGPCDLRVGFWSHAAEAIAGEWELLRTRLGFCGRGVFFL